MMLVFSCLGLVICYVLMMMMILANDVLGTFTELDEEPFQKKILS